ncbi:MAG: hypothetical protein ACTSQP_09895 [Promethearchaeota archaeon]
MDLIRFLCIYVDFMFICILFLYIGFKILKRDKSSEVNQLFFLFFFFISLGFIINFIYAPIVDESLTTLVVFMCKLVVFCVIYSLSFIILAIRLLEPNKEISSRNKILFFSFYGLICLSLFFIPKGITIKIIQGEYQEFPIYNLYFAITGISIVLFGISIFLYYARRLFIKFNNPIFIKKLKFIVYGVCFFYSLVIITLISNYLNIYTLRFYFLIISNLMIPSILSIYIGIKYDDNNNNNKLKFTFKKKKIVLQNR